MPWVTCIKVEEKQKKLGRNGNANKINRGMECMWSSKLWQAICQWTIILGNLQGWYSSRKGPNTFFWITWKWISHKCVGHRDPFISVLLCICFKSIPRMVFGKSLSLSLLYLWAISISHLPALYPPRATPWTSQVSYVGATTFRPPKQPEKFKWWKQRMIAQIFKKNKGWILRCGK